MKKRNNPKSLMPAFKLKDTIIFASSEEPVRPIFTKVIMNHIIFVGFWFKISKFQ